MNVSKIFRRADATPYGAMLLVGIFLTAIPPITKAAEQNATGLTVNCGEPTGYSFYFEGGLVSKERSGFTDDGIMDGAVTLLVSSDDPTNSSVDADVLTKDATGTIRSARASAKVVFAVAPPRGMNWLIIYDDGTLENYAYKAEASTVVYWKNTVGSESIAKNSLMVSKCSAPIEG
jgi:hypothetical protein